MYTIVFHVLQYASHLNSSFKMAKALKYRGHRIIYLNFTYTEKIITSQGFEFYPIPSDHYPPNVVIKKGSFKNKLQIYKYNKYYSKKFLKGDFYDNILNNLSPDLFVVDLSLIYYSIFLLPKNIPFLITCTKLSLSKTSNVPPFTSSFIPNNINFIVKIYIEILWQIKILKNFYHQNVLKFRYDKVSHFYLARKYLRKNKFKINETIDIKRSSHFGLKNVPELILSPIDFDYPRKFPSNAIKLRFLV